MAKKAEQWITVNGKHVPLSVVKDKAQSQGQGKAQGSGDGSIKQSQRQGATQSTEGRAKGVHQLSKLDKLQNFKGKKGK